MATGFGTNAWIGYGEESTYGTAVSTTKYAEIMEESIQGKQSIIGIETLRSASKSQVTKSKLSVEGSVKMALGYEGYERLLKHALGKNTTTGPTLSVYTHAIELDSNLPTGLTLVVNRDASNLGAGTAFQSSGCQITKATFRQAPEQLLEAEFEFLGSGWANIAVPSPTFTTFQPIDWTQIVVCDLGGTTVKCKEFELTVENALSSDRYILGNRSRVGLGRSGSRTITAKLVTELENLTLYNLYKNQTATNFSIEWSNALTGAALRRFRMDGNCYVQGDDPSVSDAGPIELTLNLEFFDTSSTPNSEFDISVVNTVATI